MAVLKRIDPASAFKVGLVTYALLGVAGAFCGAIALAGISFAPHARMPWAGSLGLLAVVPYKDQECRLCSAMSFV